MSIDVLDYLFVGYLATLSKCLDNFNCICRTYGFVVKNERGDSIFGTFITYYYGRFESNPFMDQTLCLCILYSKLYIVYGTIIKE